jgi:23S rRNA pseudouridine1911/1915/1917 synthase
MADHHWVVDPAEAGTRLDRWLAAPSRLGSRARARAALERGQVFAGEQELSLADAGRAVESGEGLRWWASRPGSAKRRAGYLRDGLPIVFEDASLIVVDKPAGLLTVRLPSAPAALSVEALLAPRTGRHAGVHVVHRIDRDTSGLVAFAKTSHAYEHLASQFVERTPQRRYLAVVEGRPEAEAGTWQDWLRWAPRGLRQEPARHGERGAREALSRYRVLAANAGASLLEVSLVTGRRHQIRVQAWLRGHPLVGERRYRTTPPGWAAGFPRQALHAWRLGLTHPHDERPLSFEAPPPEDFETLLVELVGRSWRKTLRTSTS